MYTRTTGEDFLVKAFQFARAKDPDALLIYNDYNCHKSAKRKNLIRLLTSLKAKGAPVDAFGMQGHFELGKIPFEELRETFDQLRKLDMKVVVSELDIDVVQRGRWWAEGGKYRDELKSYDPYRDGCPDKILQEQAEQYAKLFELFSEYSDIIERVSFWNLHDGQSWLNYFPWRRANYPLLFDRDRQPKPAFAAVIEVLAGDSESRQTDVEPKKEPVTFTTREDHRNMQEQLGIAKLRPGPSGNADAPNAANYDETKANPYPDWPEILKLEDGQTVAAPETWWNRRRPQIVELFEKEVYGRVPKDVPAVKWTLKESRDAVAGGIPVIEQHIVGTADNSACPEIEVEISMSLTLPKEAGRPVPVLMMFGRTPFDPVPEWMQRFRRRGPGGSDRPRGPSRTDELIAAGWGCVMINPSTIQADNGAGLTRGIIGLTNHGQPRKPDDWGSLRAWGWGASRGLDYLQTNAKVDAKRVGIEGVSRYGKAALVTMAFDKRFAMVLIGSSGAGGATPHRRNFGEAVENLTGSGEYHWMAGNFLKYAAEESVFGSKNACDIPVDSHQLIALCAPRLTFVSYGIPEKGDANWLDQRGSYMATVAASPVFQLLGVKGLGTTDDYKNEPMPPVNQGLLDGHLAWRQHDGGHTDAPNMTHFINWAEEHFADN